MRTRPSLVATTVLSSFAVALGALSPMAASAAGHPHDDVITYAHRGASGSAPENTLAAVRVAQRQHTDFVETDVRRTKDGHLVMMHDDQLTRTTNVEEVFPGRAAYWVHDFTLAEIKQLDAGSWFSPEYAGERVPTLREFVDAVGRSMGLIIEIKGALLYPGIEADLAAELRSYPGYLTWAEKTDRLRMQSFWLPSSRAIHELLPEVHTSVLYDVRPTDAALVEASAWADGINPGNGFTDKALIDRIHDLGMDVAPYVVDTGARMQELIDLGVDGIITDYPGMMYDLERATR